MRAFSAFTSAMVFISHAPIAPILQTLPRPIVLGIRAIVLAQLAETFRGLPVFHRSLADHPSAVLAIHTRDIPKPAVTVKLRVLRGAELRQSFNRAGILALLPLFKMSE